MMPQDQLGRHLRDLRISVTDRCNFRCSYCMPAGQPHPFLPLDCLLSFDEITRITEVLTGLGVTKARLTGGEPLIRPGIEKLVAALADLNGISDLAMITNGYFLPKKAKSLKDAGLHRLTVSLDSLDNRVFRCMNGNLADSQRVLAGIAAAEQAGFSPLKINTVVQRGVNDHTIVDLARYFKDRGHIVRFIEYMDAGTLNGWRMENVVSAAEIVAKIDAVMPLEPIEANYHGEVARRYRYRDGSGEMGIIASVTQPFCGACNRLRLSADGRLYTCLFARQGLNIRELLRRNNSDDDLASIFMATWQNRTDHYSETRDKTSPHFQEKIEMHYIGG
ncbi:MAG: GTP 3',8-cyclase MoaA [Anaerolineae bacterium]|nr:GTP 3',8-cyclase MoaA [Anaerolineae bacterium]